jgi:phytoene dehydrogenase-like protein
MHDVVIIGAGHNGLVCGAYLAKAGYKVLALERRDLIGGACVTESPWPGYKVSSASYLMSLLQPKIILDLELKTHGLEVLESAPTTALLDGGRSFTFWADAERLHGEIATLSARDADAYREYRAHLARMTPFIREIIWETPPDIAARSIGKLLGSARFALKYFKYRHLFNDIYDIMTMSAYDYLTRWFENDTVIALLGYYVTGGGTNASMTMPATAFSCIRPLVRDNTTAAGGGGFVRGGMGAISEAIARSGAAHGLDVRTNAAVTRILVEKGRAAGVELVDGEIVRARCVVSNANAKTTFLKLLPSAALPAPFRASIRNIRTRSGIFKVHLGVSKLPDYTAFSASPGLPYPSAIRIGSSVAYLEKAFDDAKHQPASDEPFLTIMAPSVHDPSLAPAGQHLLSIMGGHVAYQDDPSGLAQLRATILERVLATIERHAPGFRPHVLHSEVLTPNDLEERFDLPGGHVHHGDQTLDQAFTNRPVGGFADYRSPIPGLYLSSSSTHPGGGVTGVPGHNAAREIARDLRR